MEFKIKCLENIDDIYKFNINKNQSNIIKLKKKFQSQFIEEPKYYIICPFTYNIKQNYLNTDFYNFLINSENSIISATCISDLIKEKIIIENSSIKYDKFIFNYDQIDKSLKLEENKNYINIIKFTLKNFIKLLNNKLPNKSLKIMIDMNTIDYSENNFNSKFCLYNNIMLSLLNSFKIQYSYEDIIDYNKKFINVMFPKMKDNMLISYIDCLYKINNNQMLVYNTNLEESSIVDINSNLGFLKLNLCRKNSKFQNKLIINILYYELKVCFKLINIDKIDDYNFKKLILIDDMDDIKENISKNEIDKLLNMDSFFLIRDLEYSNEFFKFNFKFNLKKCANYFYNLYKEIDILRINNDIDIFKSLKNINNYELEYNFVNNKEIKWIKNILKDLNNYIISSSFYGDDLFDNLIVICDYDDINNIQNNFIENYLYKYENELLILDTIDRQSTTSSFNSGIKLFDPVNSFWL